MTSTFEDSVIKEITDTKVDFYKFALDFQYKLDNIMRIVENGISETAVAHRELQTRQNEDEDDEDLPPLKRKMPIKQDWIRAKRQFECGNEEDSVRALNEDEGSRDEVTIVNEISHNNSYSNRIAGSPIALGECKGNRPSDDSNDLRKNLDLKATRGSPEEVAKNVLSKDSLLNDLSIDAFLDIINDKTNFVAQSVHYSNGIGQVEPVKTKMRSLQIIGANIEHWRCAYFNGKGLIRIYDSFYLDYKLSDKESEYLNKRFPTAKIVPVEMRGRAQPDSTSCGVYAAAFATEIALGSDPGEIKYSKNAINMRKHFLKIVKSRKLSLFPADS